MSDDPWKSIDTSVVSGMLNARRVDAKLPWNLFWAIDPTQRCALVLRHHSTPAPKGRPPNINGLEIVITKPDEHGETVQILRLLDTTKRDVFHQLCLDIVAATARAATEGEAALNFLARTWRWHHLLKGGALGRLSLEEQKGLLGELFVLEHHLLELLSPHDAIGAWTGPQAAPKDFEVGDVCIEAKARRGAARPFVKISSEHQLTTTSTQTLFLHVLNLDVAMAGSPDRVTITDVALRIREKIQDADPDASSKFEALLTASGFLFEEDYSDCSWIVGDGTFYEVRGQFPRITTADFPAGVSNVQYAIALKECEPFREMSENVRAKLKGTQQ
jgi:hypothetical protein